MSSRILGPTGRKTAWLRQNIAGGQPWLFTGCLVPSQTSSKFWGCGIGIEFPRLKCLSLHWNPTPDRCFFSKGGWTGIGATWSKLEARKASLPMAGFGTGSSFRSLLTPTILWFQDDAVIPCHSPRHHLQNPKISWAMRLCGLSHSLQKVVIMMFRPLEPVLGSLECHTKVGWINHQHHIPCKGRQKCHLAPKENIPSFLPLPLLVPSASSYPERSNDSATMGSSRTSVDGEETCTLSILLIPNWPWGMFLFCFPLSF